MTEQLPMVSVITPCLNAERFLEETILSVLSQDYPRVEYLVMDGGSADATLDILGKYEGRLRFISGRDGGVADAINKGFALTAGAIVTWLNADDVYLPGAIGKAVRALAANPGAAAAYGEGQWMDADGKDICRYPTSPTCDFDALGRECCICQPACFMRREAAEAAGLLDASLRVSFDYDLWIRLSKAYPLAYVPELLAKSRMHRENKTLAQRRAVFEESIGLLSRYYGYVPVPWVYGQLCYRRDGRDQFFEPLRHSVLTYLRALGVGLRYNRAHHGKYFRQWLATLNLKGLLRRG